jgi:NADPH:quinone reductase-like Zn-dependent oxidoreductase
VGSFVVELLRFAQVAEIFTIAKDEKSAQFLVEKMGIARDHILIYEGLSSDQLKQNLLSMNRGEFFDATFDLVGKEMKRLCIELTGYSGHFSTILPEIKFELPFWGENDIPRGRNLSVHQVAIGAELGNAKRMQIYSRHLQALTTLLVEKRIKPPVVTVVGSLSEKTVQKAHEMLESGRSKGKLVMIVE